MYGISDMKIIISKKTEVKSKLKNICKAVLVVVRNNCLYQPRIAKYENKLGLSCAKLRASCGMPGFDLVW